MVKTKFPSLYNIVKKGDLETLSRYYDAYPETSALCELTTGKKLVLIEQALKLNQIQVVNFLIDKTPLDKLHKLVGYLVSNLKCNNDESGNPNFDYYCGRILNAIEQTGSEELKELIGKILIKICTCGFIVHDKIILNLMNNMLFDFKQRLMQNENFKWNFESKIMSEAPLRIYQLIIKYYQDNQIPLEQLLAHYLAASCEKSNKTVKMFKQVDLKSKVKICENSNTHVQLSTLFVTSGATAKLSDLLDNPNFEYELIETIKLISPKSKYTWCGRKLSYLVTAYRIEQNQFTIPYYDKQIYRVVDSDMMNYLKLYSEKLTNTFWNFLLRLNAVCTFKNNREEGEKLIASMIK